MVLHRVEVPLRRAPFVAALRQMAEVCIPAADHHQVAEVRTIVAVLRREVRLRRAPFAVVRHPLQAEAVLLQAEAVRILPAEVLIRVAVRLTLAVRPAHILQEAVLTRVVRIRVRPEVRAAVLILAAAVLPD